MPQNIYFHLFSGGTLAVTVGSISRKLVQPSWFEEVEELKCDFFAADAIAVT